MPIDSMELLMPRLDTKFGEIDAAIAAKLGPPTDAGIFDPALIDLSAGQLQYDAYAQAGPITFALDPAKTPAIGGAVLVNIVGDGSAITFASPFAGLGGLFSGVSLTAGVSYAFSFYRAADWEEVAPSVFEDRVLVQTDGLGGGGLIPSAIQTSAYQAHVGEAVRTDTTAGTFTVTAPLTPNDGDELVLEDAAEGGSWSLANPVLLITSDGSTLAGYVGADGVNHDGGSRAVWRYNGSTADWVYLAEAGGSGAGGGGTGTGDMDVATYDPQGKAADAFARANHTGAQAISTITDLSTQLAAKAPTANPTFTGTVTIPDGALAIADISGLQTAIDGKGAVGSLSALPTSGTVAINLTVKGRRYYPKLTTTGAVSFTIAASPVEGARVVLPFANPTSATVSFAADIYAASVDVTTVQSLTDIPLYTWAGGPRQLEFEYRDGKAVLHQIPAQQPEIAAGAVTGSRLSDTALNPTAIANGTPVQLLSTARHAGRYQYVTDAAGVEFQVPASASASPMAAWLIHPIHDDAIVTIVGDVGSITPATAPGEARLVNGGYALVLVRSNATGSAPTVEVTGDVITPPISTGTKTYDSDDHGLDFEVTSGTQTMPSAASLRDGFYVNIFNASGSNITVSSLGAGGSSHSIPSPGVATVKKLTTALIAVGSGGTTLLATS